MKLEVGMIARTNKGLLIDIIHDFDSELCAYKRDEITKASFNLIDLIEVGDYVNGYPVKSHFGSNAVCLNINYQKHGIDQIIKEQDIKSILTHEMYEKNCYKVVE